jgi:NAD(P)-dependent dehydrogenase (short-subunit alcohol dehydrogenase family)
MMGVRVVGRSTTKKQQADYDPASGSFMTSAGSWTPEDVPDLSGRVVVVTGANSGIGFEATRLFVENGAHVVLACRSTDRGENARRKILETDPPGTAEVLELDLADLESVRAFTDRVLEGHDRLDVLVNNAGVMFLPYRETEDGFQVQFGVNHLGHFALTGLLLDRLVETDGESRVVTVASEYHRQGTLENLEEIHDAENYGKHRAYGDSKLANVLFAYELQHRLLEADHGVTSVAVHPGYADTDLQRRGPEQEGSRLKLLAMKVANAVFGQSAEQGAWPTVFAATHPGIHGGEYVGPGGIMNMRGGPEIQESSDRSLDGDLAHRLWERSQEWTGVEFGLPARGEGDAAGAGGADQTAGADEEPTDVTDGSESTGRATD